MLFSIITVCYNAPRLDETCTSVSHQICKDYEWIVIDGGSTAEHIETLNKYKEYMSYFISEKDNGVYFAMNKGIQRAKGDYLIFMNAGDSFADDFVLLNISSWLEKQEKQPDVIYGMTNRNKSGDIHIPPTKFNDYIFFNNSLCHQATFIKKNLFIEFGSYNTDAYRILADFDKFNQYYVNGKSFVFVPVIISNYYTDGISSTKNTEVQKEKKQIHHNYFSEKKILKMKKQQLAFYFSFLSRKFSHIFQGFFQNRKLFRELQQNTRLIERLFLENDSLKNFIEEHHGN